MRVAPQRLRGHSTFGVPNQKVPSVYGLETQRT